MKTRSASALAAIGLALFAAGPALAARSISPYVRAVAVALNPHLSYQNSTLLKISQLGGEELLDPLADALEAELKANEQALADFDLLDPNAKIASLEKKLPRAITQVQDRAKQLAADIRQGLLDGKNPTTLHDDASRYQRIFEPYLANSGANRELSMARNDAWKAIRAQLAAGGDVAAGMLAAGKSDGLAGSAVVAIAPGIVAAATPTSLKREEPRGAYGLSEDELKARLAGLSIQFEKKFSEADVQSFAQDSGDMQRAHLDPAFAARSKIFKGERPVHGWLSSSGVSAALGMRLTEPISRRIDWPAQDIVVALVNANVDFLRPVNFDKEVVTTVTFKELRKGGKIIVFSIEGKVGGKTVFSGETSIALELLEKSHAA